MGFQSCPITSRLGYLKGGEMLYRHGIWLGIKLHDWICCHSWCRDDRAQGGEVWIPVPKCGLIELSKWCFCLLCPILEHLHFKSQKKSNLPLKEAFKISSFDDSASFHRRSLREGENSSNAPGCEVTSVSVLCVGDTQKLLRSQQSSLCTTSWTL